MKLWAYDQIAPAAAGAIDKTIADWPYLRQALEQEGIRLPGDTVATTITKICKLVLAERKTTEANADSDEVKSLQLSLLARDVYANRHDIVECRRGYEEAFAFIGWLSNLEEVDYIAARVGNGKPA